MAYIYGLYNSLDGIIRYVGKTRTKPSQRRNQHIAGCIGEKKNDWIDEVYSCGGEVRVCTLEEVNNRREELYREGYWIYGLKARGNELVNSSPVSTDVLYRLYDEYELRVRLTEREGVLVDSVEEFCKQVIESG